MGMHRPFLLEARGSPLPHVGSGARANPHECLQSRGCETSLLHPGVHVQAPCRSEISCEDAREVQNLCHEGRVDKALAILLRVDKQGSVPSVQIYQNLLQACMKRKALDDAKRVQAHLAERGLESNRVLGDLLVTTLVKCGSLRDALLVFHRLSHRSVFSWTAIISGYGNAGRWREALSCYEQMLQEGIQPDKYTLVSLLKACSKLQDLQEGKRLHSHARRHGFESDIYVANTLVSMYAKCGSTLDAQEVFDRLDQRDLVSWNAMLSAYAQQAQGEQALQLFEEMQEHGVRGDAWTFVSAIQACGALVEKEQRELAAGQNLWLERAKGIHSEAARLGYESDPFVGSSLISMYGKWKRTEDAQQVFDRLSHRNVVSWNAILAAYAHDEQGATALLMFEQMLEQGIVPDGRTFVSAIQACSALAEHTQSVELELGKVALLRKGKEIHVEAAVRGFEADVFVGNTLVSMYAKCGSLTDAQHVFDRLPHRNGASWTAMISAYAQQHQPDKALQLYLAMQEAKVTSDPRTFVSALQACSTLAEQEETILVHGQNVTVQSLHKAIQIHSDAIRCGHGYDIFVGSTLVTVYAKCGWVEAAQMVYNQMSQHTIVSINAMIAGFAHKGKGEQALQIYAEMPNGIKPDARTIVSALQACSALAEKEESSSVSGQHVKVEALLKCKEIHAEAVRLGYGSDVFVGTALVSMYAKCGSIINAEQEFDQLSQRDTVSWNSMLAAFVEQGQGERALQVYEQMQVQHVQPNARTFVSAIEACIIIAEKEDSALVGGQYVKWESLQKGRDIHLEAAERGFQSDSFLSCSLISLYAKCGNVVEARDLCARMPLHNVTAWTAMIAAYVQHDQGEKALEIFWRIQEEGLKASSQTFVSALQACSSLAGQEESALVNGQNVKVESLCKGKQVHAVAAATGLNANVFIGSSLVHMYAKCGSIMDARNVFDQLSDRNIVAWNVMIAAYSQQDQGEEALRIYEQMQGRGIKAEARTFVSTLQACSTLAEKEESIFVDGQKVKANSLRKGKAIHAEAAESASESNMFVANTLVNLYAKCGSVYDARLIFDSLCPRDVVSWNAMIAAYATHDQGEKALQLYAQMQVEGMKLQETTALCVLDACSNTGALNSCVQIHKSIVESGFECNLFVASSLIHAYSKCGSMLDAQYAFDLLPQPDIVSRNALIAGYARQGDCDMSMQCYEEMCLAGERPDRVTFLALLSSCSHAGMVDRGLECFECMTRYHGITADVEHYACVLDLLGRAGLFCKAEDLLSTMPMQPDLPIWLTLLGACQKHGNVALGRRSFERAVSLDSEQSAAYVLMSNIYADAGMWDCANEIDELRGKACARKKPGQTWIEHEKLVHTFLVEDHRHPQASAIFALLSKLSAKLKSSRED